MKQMLIQKRMFKEGVRTGYVHEWDYPNGKWIEQKVSSKDWAFRFSSSKKKTNSRKKSGAIMPPVGYKVIWRIEAIQRAVKTGRGEYQTQMVGKKSILAFFDPKKNRWMRLSRPKVFDIVPIKYNVPKVRKLNAKGGINMANKVKTYRTKKGNLIRFRGGVKLFYSRKLKRWIPSKFQSSTAGKRARGKSAVRARIRGGRKRWKQKTGRTSVLRRLP